MFVLHFVFVYWMFYSAPLRLVKKVLFKKSYFFSFWLTVPAVFVGIFPVEWGKEYIITKCIPEETPFCYP